MVSNLNKRYVVGPTSKMKEFFPQYGAGDERYSFDGSQVIYEVNLTNEELTDLKKKTSVKVCTHAEIIALINAPTSAGIWYVTSGFAQVQPEPGLNE